MKVNEMFMSIQGEGKYAGQPVLFIRLSGCTRECEWCDTKHHTEGKEMSVEAVVKQIKKFLPEKGTIVWTGGEPTLQLHEIKQVNIELNTTPIWFKPYQVHLETNGDIAVDYNCFDYVSFSPKNKTALLNVLHNITHKDVNNYDIKVVTDLDKIGIEMLKDATMLMPFSTGDESKDRAIEQKVWKYCVEHKKKFCLRQHIKVWGYGKRTV